MSRNLLRIVGAFLFFFILIGNIKIYKSPLITTWDNLGYYAYLPQVFIENDPGIKDPNPIYKAAEKYDLGVATYQFLPNEKGNYIPKYTFGIAALNFPAFIIGHVWAKSSNYAADGYSYPYQMSLVIWNTFLILASLLLLFRIFLNYFSQQISLLLILLLVFGTNYYVFAIGGRSLPHLPLFFLYTVLLHCTIRWHKNYSNKYAMFIGLVVGLLTLSRPAEIISLFIPVFWNISSVKHFKSRIVFLFKKNIRQTIIMAVSFVFCLLPQLVYWKIYTGNFFYFSYTDASEGFEFLNPHFLEFLFGFRKGWFLYTPIMFLAFTGLIYGIIYKKENSLLLTIFLLINVYVLSSWVCWWYATSFGQRALVQTYPIYLIGLGYFLQFIFSKSKGVIIFITTLLIGLTGLNQFQIWQMEHGIIDLSRMTKPYYFAVFGKTNKPANIDTLLLVSRDSLMKPELKELIRYRKFAEFPFEPNSEDNNSINRNYSCDSLRSFGKAISARFDEFTNKDHAWLKISFEYCLEDTVIIPDAIVFAHSVNKYGDPYYWQGVTIVDSNKIKLGQFVPFHTYYLTAEAPRLPSDLICANVWLRSGNGKIKIRNFKVESFVRKY